MTNPHEPFGQDMQQESPQELCRAERDRPTPTTSGIISDTEGDLAVFALQQASVGDRHPMRVAGEILEHHLRSAERSLGIDDPLFANGALEAMLPGVVLSERSELAVQLQFSPAVCLLEQGDELAAEDAAEDTHREEEVAVCRNPLRPAG